MEERIRPTRSGLFAIELLIAVGVFSLCAAICVGLFVRAEVMSQDSADLNQAVSHARTVAEDFKAAGGDLDRTAALTGGTLEGGVLRMVYDGNWQSLDDCGAGAETVFLLELTPQPAEGYAAAELRVTGPLAAEEDMTAVGLLVQAAEMQPLLAWQIAALEVTP